MMKPSELAARKHTATTSSEKAVERQPSKTNRTILSVSAGERQIVIKKSSWSGVKAIQYGE
jgi:hypothetical protein